MHIYSITPYHRCIAMNLSFQSVFVFHCRHNGKYFLILLYEVYWFNRKIVMKYSLVNTFLRKANSKFYCQPIICQTSNKHWKFTYFRIYFEQVSSRNSLFFKLFQGYGTLQEPLRLSEFSFRNMKCQNGNFLAKSSPGPTKRKKMILSETWVIVFLQECVLTTWGVE